MQAHLLRRLPRPVDVPKVFVRLDAAQWKFRYNLPNVSPGDRGVCTRTGLALPATVLPGRALIVERPAPALPESRPPGYQRAARHISTVQAVDETAAARPTAESAASALAARVEEDDADLDVDWIALAQQRQAEVMAQARALREDLTPLPTLPPPPARRAPQAPIGTPQAPIGTPNPNWQRDSFQRESSC